MNEWMIGLIIFGFLMILVEIILVPGVGIAGIIGTICLMAGIFLLGREHGAMNAFLTFVGSVVVIVLIFIGFFRSPASRWLVQKDMMKAKNVDESPLSVGMTGKTTTPLYPTGRAEFLIGDNKKEFDVIANGEFIEQAVDVEIHRVEGNRVFVDPTHETAS